MAFTKLKLPRPEIPEKEAEAAVIPPALSIVNKTMVPVLMVNNPTGVVVPMPIFPPVSKIVEVPVSPPVILAQKGKYPAVILEEVEIEPPPPPLPQSAAAVPNNPESKT